MAVQHSRVAICLGRVACLAALTAGTCAVLLASALLAIELLVQIPFLGFSVLQLIFGAVAIGMAVVGLLARRAVLR